jgi:hypothetical protein
MSEIKRHELLTKKKFHAEQADKWMREFAVTRTSGSFETIVSSEDDSINKVFFDVNSLVWSSGANRIYLDYCQDMCQFHIGEVHLCDFQLNKLMDHEREAANSYATPDRNF